MTPTTSNADGSRYAYVPFKLAKYAFDGTFLGWETLSNQIYLCPITYSDSSKIRKVGQTLDVSCKFDVRKLVDKTIELPNLNYFFELFLVDYNGDLIDVPVLIDNFVDATGTYPNKDKDTSKWRFVRRFFLYENITAIEGTGEYLNPTKLPTYVKYLKECLFVFELDRNGNENIYVPYLHLYYESIATALVTSQYPVEVSIKTQWIMSSSHFFNIALGFLIGYHVLVVVWCLWKAYVWILLHPQNYESAYFLIYLGVQMIYEVFKAWATLTFWFLFLC